MATPGSPSRGLHRRTLSTTNIALRSGSAVSGVLHLAAALWASLHFWRLSGVWATLFALPALSLAGTSVYINLRKRELLTFSERKRTRTVIINFALSLIWAIACASTLWQTVRSSSPLPLLVPAVCGGLSLFAAWNAVYAVVLALGPGEK